MLAGLMEYDPPDVASLWSSGLIMCGVAALIVPLIFAIGVWKSDKKFNKEQIREALGIGGVIGLIIGIGCFLALGMSIPNEVQYFERDWAKSKANYISHIPVENVPIHKVNVAGPKYTALLDTKRDVKEISFDGTVVSTVDNGNKPYMKGKWVPELPDGTKARWSDITVYLPEVSVYGK